MQTDANHVLREAMFRLADARNMLAAVADSEQRVANDEGVMSALGCLDEAAQHLQGAYGRATEIR